MNIGTAALLLMAVVVAVLAIGVWISTWGKERP